MHRALGPSRRRAHPPRRRRAGARPRAARGQLAEEEVRCVTQRELEQATLEVKLLQILEGFYCNMCIVCANWKLPVLRPL